MKVRQKFNLPICVPLQDPDHCFCGAQSVGNHIGLTVYSY